MRKHWKRSEIASYGTDKENLVQINELFELTIISLILKSLIFDSAVIA